MSQHNYPLIDRVESFLRLAYPNSKTLIDIYTEFFGFDRESIKQALRNLECQKLALHVIDNETDYFGYQFNNWSHEINFINEIKNFIRQYHPSGVTLSGIQSVFPLLPTTTLVRFLYKLKIDKSIKEETVFMSNEDVAVYSYIEKE